MRPFGPKTITCLFGQKTKPEETEPTEPTETEHTEPTKTEPEETEPVETFPVTGSANYDLGMIRDILFVPNGIDTAYEEENYVLTGYINNINTQYTQVLVEYGTSGAYGSVYEYGTQRTSMYQNGQVYSYEYDGRGSVSELVNAIGDTQIKYSYGAYGETVSTVIGWNNPVTNPYRYNAERIDDVAGVPAFQYLRARYLNPYTASFLTQDSYLGQLTSPLSQNRYTYAHNNPVLYADPSGHSVILGLVILGGILFGSGTATYLIADHEEDKAEEAYQAAVENFNVQMEAMEGTGQLISGIYASAQHAYQAGDFASLSQTYLSLQTAYADYGNQFAKACTAMDEANRQAEKAGKANSWKRIGFGVGMTGLGLAAVGFAPALPEAASALFFNGMPVVGEMAGLLEFGGTVVGTTTTFYGVNDVTEGVTGVNPLRDVFYGTDEAARMAYAQDEQFLANASTAVIGLGLYGDMTERIRQNAMAGQSQIPSSTDNQAGMASTPQYEYNMIENPGPLAEMEGNPASNFAGGKYNEVTLTEDTTFYRAGKSDTPLGQWYTETPVDSVAQARIDLAIKPQWIDPQTGALTGTSVIDSNFAVSIPAGTTVYTGPVGYQGGVYLGGNTTQVFIPTPWNIDGVTVVSSTPLH